MMQVGYYQQPLGNKIGFNVSFGIQAGLAGIAIVIVIGLQLYGSKLRARGGPVAWGKV